MAAQAQVFERYEKKFMLSRWQADELLRRLSGYIRQDEYCRYSICTLYLDSADFTCARAGERNAAYKQKLRLRSYGEPQPGGTVYLELKNKLEGVTYKRRVPLLLGEAMDYIGCGAPTTEQGQVMQEIDWFRRHHALGPKIALGYDRLAFQGEEDDGLRITFDSNICWRYAAQDTRLGLDGSPLIHSRQVLMEVKTPGALPLWLCRHLSQVGAAPVSFSKYRAAYGQYMAGSPAAQGKEVAAGAATLFGAKNTGRKEEKIHAG